MEQFVLLIFDAQLFQLYDLLKLVYLVYTRKYRKIFEFLPFLCRISCSRLRKDTFLNVGLIKTLQVPPNKKETVELSLDILTAITSPFRPIIYVGN